MHTDLFAATAIAAAWGGVIDLATNTDRRSTAEFCVTFWSDWRGMGWVSSFSENYSVPCNHGCTVRCSRRVWAVGVAAVYDASLIDVYTGSTSHDFVPATAREWIRLEILNGVPE